MKRKLFWKNVSRNTNKRLNLLLDSGTNKRKKSGSAVSAGIISKGILGIIFIAVAAFVLLFLSKSVMALFMEDPKFNIAGIEVSNARVFSNNEITSIAGLSAGANIFRVDINECKKRLEENPNIKKASITRLFPDRINIRVYEREPAAVIDIGKNYLIDDECVLLSWDERWDVKALPVITGLERAGKFADKKVVSANLEEGVRLISLYNVTRLKPIVNLLKVDVSNVDEIVFYTDKDFSFKMAKGCGKEKFEQLLVVYEDLKAKGNVPSVIDLRFQDVVVLPGKKHESKKKEEQK